MRAPISRLAGLLCLALLTTLLPSASPHVARAAAPTLDLPLGWATYLGGSGGGLGRGIATDSHGSVYVTGDTASADFPVTPGAAQPVNRNPHNGNAFVASYDGQGRLRWATYLGGSGDGSLLGDEGDGIATDGQGNVYVTGYTNAANFPVTPGAAQSHAAGAFVASYDASGHVRWATYLGGSGGDGGSSIATDGQGNVYVTGDTRSINFPVTPGAAQPHNLDPQHGNAFVASYDGHGHLRWATYLGGSNNAGYRNGDGEGDEGTSVAIGSQGTVYVTGVTGSTDFPITPGAAQSIYQGDINGDGFVARLIVPTTRPAALDPASPPPGTPHTRYFPATHHTLAGAALAFWDRLGGTPTLGLPLSEPITLAGRRLQVSERAVLLLDPGGVRLLPLGRLLSAARTFAPVSPVPSSATQLNFASTGHTLSGRFLAYWQAHQGSALLGAPISEPDREGLGDGTGRVSMVQWFVNGRLEYHPENADPRYQVEQGRVGYEYLHRAGLL